MSQIQRRDQQIMLSKNLLSHALLELMEEKPYKQITVTELSKRADISRRTFYRHFNTIDDVLNHTLEATAERFLLYYLENDPKELKDKIYLYFSYWEKRKFFLFTLNKNGLLYFMLQKFLPTVREKLALYYNIEDTKAENTEYIFNFYSGGIWNMIVKWVEDRAVLSPQQIYELADEIKLSIRK